MIKHFNIEKQFITKRGFLFAISACIFVLLSLFPFLTFSESASVTHDIATGVTIGTAEFGNSFTPAIANIQIGETVTFTSSGGGFHNVVFDDEVPGGLIPSSFVASPATSQPWTVTVKFDEPGNYFFFCTPHKDDGMVGRITVDAPSQEFYIPLIAR